MRPEILDSAFDLLEDAAKNGRRCPFSDQVPGSSKSFSLLARQGRILVEVFCYNFRRVTILVGPNKGVATTPPPGRGAKPFLVVRQSGTFRNGKEIDLSLTSRRRVALSPTAREKADPVDRLAGTHTRIGKRICFASGCENGVTDSNFCERHQYKAPANVAQLTRGRA